LLAELTSVIGVLPFHQQEAQAAAGIRARLEQQGTPIGPCDILIPGTARRKKFGKVRIVLYFLKTLFWGKRV